LLAASDDLKRAKQKIDVAWKISEPFTQKQKTP
jgi:hypothetical protein